MAEPIPASYEMPAEGQDAPGRPAWMHSLTAVPSAPSFFEERPYCQQLRQGPPPASRSRLSVGLAPAKVFRPTAD